MFFYHVFSFSNICHCEWYIRIQYPLHYIYQIASTQGDSLSQYAHDYAELGVAGYSYMDMRWSTHGHLTCILCMYFAP